MVKNKMMLLLTVFAFGALIRADDDETYFEKGKKQVRAAMKSPGIQAVGVVVGAQLASNLYENTPLKALVGLPGVFVNFYTPERFWKFAKPVSDICSVTLPVSGIVSYGLSGLVFPRDAQLGRSLGLVAAIFCAMQKNITDKQIASIASGIQRQNFTKGQCDQILTLVKQANVPEIPV